MATHSARSRPGAPGRYLAIAFASAAALLAAAGLLSYRYDPGEQFHKPDSRSALQALLAGQTVAYEKNLDLRFVFQGLAERVEVPELLLLGSSVTSNASTAMLPEGTRFLNLSVNGGTLVDAVGLLAVYERRGVWPRRLLLWLDGSSFDPERRDPRWRSLAAGIDRFSRRLGAPVERAPRPNPLSELRQIVSWGYGSEAVRALLRHGGFATTRIVSESEADAMRVLRPDGSRSWGYQDPDVSYVERAAAEAVAEGYADRLMAFHRLPGGLAANPQLRLLEQLLDHLATRGVEVTLLVTPFAPGALDALGGARGEGWVLDAYAELDRTLARVARDHGARFAGSSLASRRQPSCGGDGHLDFHHLRDPCLAYYLAAACSGAPPRLAHRED